jgi:rhodanese-related sulfurtransferase
MDRNNLFFIFKAMKPHIPWLLLLKQDLSAFWVIASASLCVGLLVNQFRDKPLSLTYQTKAERLELAVSKVVRETSVNNVKTEETLSKDISLEQFRTFVEGRRVLVLDARPEIFHRLGHVPGALSLARDDFEKSYAKLKDQLEKNKDQPLILYCSNTSCEDSHLVQKALSKLGYTNVSIFSGGWAVWTQAQLPEETNP